MSKAAVAANINTVSQFAEACKTLTSEEIYELFEFSLSEEMRDKIYAIADNPDAFEPVREAMCEIGKQFNVQALIDY